MTSTPASTTGSPLWLVERTIGQLRAITDGARLDPAHAAWTEKRRSLAGMLEELLISDVELPATANLVRSLPHPRVQSAKRFCTCHACLARPAFCHRPLYVLPLAGAKALAVVLLPTHRGVPTPHPQTWHRTFSGSGQLSGVSAACEPILPPVGARTAMERGSVPLSASHALFFMPSPPHTFILASCVPAAHRPIVVNAPVRCRRSQPPGSPSQRIWSPAAWRL